MMIVLPKDPSPLADQCRRLWVVRKDGNDANRGDASDRARLTLASVVADADLAAGDAILFGPGTWSESADLSALSAVTIVGAGQEATKLTSSVQGTRTLKLGNIAVLRGLTVHHSVAAPASETDAAIELVDDSLTGMLRLDDVHVDCEDGAAIKGGDNRPIIRIFDSWIEGAERGLVSAKWSTIIERTTIRVRDWAVCNANALQCNAPAFGDGLTVPYGYAANVIRNCAISAESSAPGSEGSEMLTSAVAVDAGQWLFDGCSFFAWGRGGEYTYAVAALIADQGYSPTPLLRTLFRGCQFHAIAAAGGTPYQIWQIPTTARTVIDGGDWDSTLIQTEGGTLTTAPGSGLLPPA